MLAQCLTDSVRYLEMLGFGNCHGDILCNSPVSETEVVRRMLYKWRQKDANGDYRTLLTAVILVDTKIALFNVCRFMNVYCSYKE